MIDNAVSQLIANEMLARFPIIGPQFGDGDVEPNYQVGACNNKVSLNRAAPIGEMGRLDYDVHVESHSNISGFVGGAYFRLLDERANVIYAISGDSHGVNSKVIPGPDKYAKPEFKPIPFDVLTIVHQIEVNRARIQGAAWEKLKETLDGIAKGASSIKDDIKEIGGDVEEIVKIIKGG